MNFIHSQKEPGLTAYHDSEHGKYRFLVSPKTYQELGYFGRIRVASEAKNKLQYQIADHEYGGNFARTKNAGVLFGSFSNSVASIGTFYFNNQK